jgi:SEC-C motif
VAAWSAPTLKDVITHVETVRPGRNDPCHCGSEKKYKRCCSGADEEAASEKRRRAGRIRGMSYEHAPPEVLAAKERSEREQRGIREQLARDFGVLINVVAPVEFEGGKVWAIGSRVYTGAPPRQTFHEFILGVLRGELGKEWADSQEALDPADRHYFYRCFTEYREWSARIGGERTPDADGLWEAEPSGSTQYLIGVAWDLASLLHATNGKVPAALLGRLRERGEFQGARYELAVAALLARLDCAIQFLDDDALRDRKHGELIATHRPSGLRFVVEAKSRHRGGVINEPGAFDADTPLEGEPRGVRNLINRASEKEAGGLPLLIFVDYNAPVSDAGPGTGSDWKTEVTAMVDRKLGRSAGEPATFGALYVTNFSPHFQGSDIARGGEWLCMQPLHTTAPIPVELIERMNYALDRFDRVPDITATGKVR